MSEEINEIIPDEFGGQRLDKCLSSLIDEISRERLKKFINGKQVYLDGEACTDPSYKVKGGEEVSLTVTAQEAPEMKAENIPLDIVFEDEHLLVINKPAGLVVHPGAGNWNHTLVNALLYHCGNNLSSNGGNERPGIVHRLDKDTSGLILAAKTNKAHAFLTQSLQDRDISRKYLAVVLGVPCPVLGTVEMNITRQKNDRTRMMVTRAQGRTAVTHYRTVENIEGHFSVVECTLETGRTHQIRVHMSFLGHNVIGDPVYSAQKTAIISAATKAGFTKERKETFLNFPRQALHAAKISFIHPETKEEMHFESDLPEDIKSLL